jgi:hypothetical protein
MKDRKTYTTKKNPVLLGVPKVMKKIILAILLILFASIATVCVSKGNFSLTTDNTQSAQQSSSKTTDDPQLSPSLTLLGAGAQWAGSNGTNALYVDFYDNVIANPNPYAPNLSALQQQRVDISTALEQYGFNVTFAANIPSNLSGYNVVVIDAYWACSPANEPIIRDFISGGGGVVLFEGVPSYLSNYCTNWWPGGDLSLIQDWFGASIYTNAGCCPVTVTINNPFGTSLSAGSSLGQYNAGYSYAAVADPLNGSTVVAQWETGEIFSMTNEYGQGRVYYQASYSDTLPPEITAINISPSQPTSNDTVKIDVSTNQPQNESSSLTVLFSYNDSFGQQWNTTMTYDGINNVWEVMLPQQPSGTNVQFSVTVTDNNGNQALMESNYTVS